MEGVVNHVSQTGICMFGIGPGFQCESSLVVVGFLFIHFNQGLVQAGIGGLILTSLLNVWL